MATHLFSSVRAALNFLHARMFKQCAVLLLVHHMHSMKLDERCSAQLTEFLRDNHQLSSMTHSAGQQQVEQMTAEQSLATLPLRQTVLQRIVWMRQPR